MRDLINSKRDVFMKDKVFLGGSFPIIAGIILMLLPFSLFWETADVICDIIGFMLMVIGLLMLDKEVHGFKTAAGFAALSAILSAIVLIFEPGHLFAILPMVSYCFVLYFMCSRFSAVADRIGEHHMAHHFISHMWIDIVATSVELLAHVFGVHGFLFYILLAAAIYFEIQLMLHIYRFDKKFNDYANYRIA